MRAPGAAGSVGAVDDLGPPISYLVLKDGTPVYDRGGERIGVVEHVLADEAEDIFHGLVVHTRPLPGRHLFAARDQIAALYEGGVLLSVGAADLPEPAEPAARREVDRGPADPVRAGLRRAWDWIRNNPSGTGTPRRR